MPFLLKSKPKNTKIICGVALVALLLLFYSNSAFSLFSLLRGADSYWCRYGYGILLMLVAICAYLVTRSWFNWGMVVPASVIFGSLMILLQFIEPYRSNTAYLYAMYVVVFGFLLKRAHNTGWRNKLSVGILAIMVVAEIFANAYLVANNHLGMIGSDKLSIYISEQQNQIDGVKKKDSDGFYRIAQTAKRDSIGDYSGNYNEGLAYGYSSIAGYTSSPDNKQQVLLDKLGYRSLGGVMNIVDEPLISTDSLLGVKYILSPHDVAGSTKSEEHESNNTKNVYVNDNALPVVFTVEDDMPNRISSTSVFMYQNELFERLSGVSDLYTGANYTKNDIDGTTVYELEDDVNDAGYIIYGDIRLKPECDSTITIGSKVIRYNERAWQIPSLLRIDSNKVVVNTSSDNVVQAEFYKLNLGLLHKAVGTIEAGNTVSKYEVGDNVINIDADGRRGKYLFTSIPYDKGWSITINNDPVRPELFEDSLILIPLRDGANNIKMTYEIPGLKLGVVATAMCSVGMTIWYIVKRFVLTKTKSNKANADAMGY